MAVWHGLHQFGLTLILINKVYNNFLSSVELYNLKENSDQFYISNYKL